ncbi:BREX system P-loop protein BrxC [Clostridium sp. 001]|uniref:BREX system P-loop protein BrxC n=1 Tax=Clostridium sp. 001 TaxID=1970093 RepID=UPI001C2B78EA|nr:BREX system P-loop protein BrxC [Clostridium sp. 001]QXE18355.1 hypothetical protein B5S50_05605 [Clostridium sp. 001]
MELKKMFLKDIERDIKGVIKVGQDDDSDIFQELDEYVVTNELLGHFGDFFEAYKKGILDHTDKMGVWISGFFGSGKSHFLKILSYLLENRVVNGKKSIEYFDNKVYDPMVVADMKQAGDITADVILFNIDSKSESDSKADKDSILKVFNKVFNEMQGFCGSIPWVADLERQMVKDEVYEDFKAEFEKISGSIWEDAREDFFYEEDSIVDALSKTTKMSEETARDWYNKAEENYSLSIEKFAQRVKEYIETKGKNHHVLFLVDEIGQYIGSDSQLMLNLQTVVEDLGTYCGGKAWVIVTSQQDIDSVTKVKGNDFSKIQGRFNTRLSLSSANVDEVIKKRILQKKPGAADSLKLLYEDKCSILKNLITFSNDTAEMKVYENENDFAEVYPFIPYQFNLLQSVFTGIRIHGASGKHLAEGERSLLSAFQESSIKYENEEMGVLIPFSAFYDTIESFLDANIKTVIIHAKNNSKLNEEDVEVLKLLFMIKYVKEIPSNLENISTLLVKHIDDDKLEIKKKVEESLKKLVRQTLIQKNGEEYIFLTHEEQDVNREIKNITIDMGEVIQKVGGTIFEEIYTEKKYRYSSKYDFPYNAMIDDIPRGQQNNEIGLKVITPYFETGVDLTHQELKLMSARENNVIIKLPNDTTFLEEMEEILKIQAYLRVKSGTASTQVIEDIKTRKSREVSERKDRVKNLLIEGLKTAEIFANSELLDIKEKNPVERINDAFKTLIDTLYSKLNYIKEYIDSSRELQDILLNNNVQGSFIEEKNKLAIDEVNSYIERNTSRNIPITMKGIIGLYSKAPYGWVELDIAAIIIKLFKAQEIKIEYNSQYLTTDDRDVVKYLTKRDYLDKVLVKKRAKTPVKYITNVKELCKELFNYSAVPADEDGLMNRFKDLTQGEIASIRELLVYYKQANYPGKNILDEGKKIFDEAISIKDTMEFYEKCYELKDDFLDYADYSEDVKKFFKNQKKFFDDALEKIEIYNKNKTYVLDDQAIDLIQKIKDIIKSKEPYSKIPQLPGLIEEFSNRFTDLLEVECEPVRKVIQSDCEKVLNELSLYEFKDELSAKFQKRFDDLIGRLDRANNFYEAIAMKEESDRLKMRSFEEISREVERRKPPVVSNPELVIGGGTDIIRGEKPPVYKTKKTKNISIANILHGAKTIETEADIDELLKDIKAKLKQELNEDTRIKLV